VKSGFTLTGMALLLLVWAVGSVGALPGDAAGSTRPPRVLFVTDLLKPATKHDLRGIAYLGFLRAVKDFKLDGRVVQINPFPFQTARQKLASFARQNYDLIYTGAMAPETVGPVALEFPKTRFLYPFPIQLLDHKPKNVQGIETRDWEASYLAGYLAALMEQRRPGRHVISSVGGYRVELVTRMIAAYEAGARKADPRITTLRGFANDFTAPAKCKAVAEQQIGAGSGVVFNVAGACGLGALEAAKEKRVWGVGVDVDESFLGRHILTSEVSNIDRSVYSELRSLARGKFTTGGNTVWDLRNGGVGLGAISPQVPRAVLRQVERIRVQIAAGRIRVPTTLR
jgi:basic membrane protein A